MLELIFLLISILLVLACGLFVMAEFALITVNRSNIEKRAEKGDVESKSILKALSSLSTQLSSAQVGITITNLAIGFLAEPAIAYFLKDPLTTIGVPVAIVPHVSLTIGLILATAITMVFGELIPKNIAISKPLTTTKFILRPLLFFTMIMKYPIKLLNSSANLILGVFKVEPQEELASARSADELLSLVRRSAEKGTLASETATILEKSLAFGDQTALDIMTPRVQVHALHVESTLDETLQLAKRTGLSRFPVYDKSIDDIVGIMHIKHVFGLSRMRRKSTMVKEVMGDPVLVPSTIELEPLLEALRHGGLQMAVVIDEFGGVDGIVTIEDVLEELVGEVRDEHDRTQQDIRYDPNGSWLLSGLLRPDEIAEQISIILPDEDEVETIGGLLIQNLEHIPKTNEYIQIPAVDAGGDEILVRLTVKRMQANRIDRIQLEVVPSDAIVSIQESKS